MLGTWFASIVMSPAIKLGIRNLVLALVAGGFAVAGLVFLLMALHAWLATMTSPVIAALAMAAASIVVALIVFLVRAYTPAGMRSGPQRSHEARPATPSITTMAAGLPIMTRVATPVLALSGSLFASFRRRPARYLIGAVIVGALTEILSSRDRD